MLTCKFIYDRETCIHHSVVNLSTFFNDNNNNNNDNNNDDYNNINSNIIICRIYY